MPLSPPVVFLNGTWQDNFSQLKSMDLTAYGFQVTSGLNPAWIDSDPDNINGSDRIIAVGNPAFTGFGSAVVLMGYFSISIKGYSSNPDASDYNPTFSTRITLAASSSMTLALVAYHSTTSETDNRTRISYESYTASSYRKLKFNEVRIIMGGLLSNTENWGISIARNQACSPSIVSYDSRSDRYINPTISAASDGSDKILSYRTEYTYSGTFDYDTPGESVLVQLASGIPVYKASNCWVPGMPPFVIWDGRIFGSIRPGIYLEMGSAFI